MIETKSFFIIKTTGLGTLYCRFELMRLPFSARAIAPAQASWYCAVLEPSPYFDTIQNNCLIRLKVCF